MSDGIYVDNENLHYTNSGDRDAGQRRYMRVRQLEAENARLTKTLEWIRKYVIEMPSLGSNGMAQVRDMCDEALHPKDV